MKIIFFGLLIRLFIAVWNSFFGPVLGAEGDALTFHLTAQDYSVSLEMEKFRYGWIYSFFLGIIYFLTYDYLFIGCLISCLAWLISAIIFDKTLALLEIEPKKRNLALWIYVLMPSSILFTSVTLREVYQLLFVTLAVYSGLRIYLDRDLRYWLFLIVSAVGMGILHVGLVAYAMFFSVLVFYFQTARKNFITLESLIFYIPFLIGLSVIAITNYSNLSSTGGTQYDFNQGLAYAVQNYQAGHNEARAMYTYKPQIDSFLGLLLFMPVSLMQYLFEPLPWRIGTLFDLALFLENLIRGIMILFLISFLLKSEGQSRKLAFFIFLSYFALETLWAMGTVNWGAAARHHIPALSLLIFGAFLSFSNRLNNSKL